MGNKGIKTDVSKLKFADYAAKLQSSVNVGLRMNVGQSYTLLKKTASTEEVKENGPMKMK